MNSNLMIISYKIMSSKISNVTVRVKASDSAQIPCVGDKVSVCPSPEHTGEFTVKERTFVYNEGSQLFEVRILLK